MTKKKITLITTTAFAASLGVNGVTQAADIQSVNHDLDKLTTQEKAKIKQGDAHASELKCGGVVHFVYKEKSGKLATTTATIEPISKLPDALKTTKNNKTVKPQQVVKGTDGRVIKVLPKTGDVTNPYLVLIGFVMLGGGAYLVYRYKSKAGAAAVALLVGFGGFNANALAANFGDVHQALIEQDVVVHETIEGYDYVGYFLESTGTCQLEGVTVDVDKTKVPETITVDKSTVEKEKLPDVIIKEVPKEIIKEIIKVVPVEVIKEIPVEVIKEVPVEKIVEVIKEVPVEKIKYIPVEVIKEVPVEKIKEVVKIVTVEVIKEVPVEKIKEIIREVPVEVIKEVPVEVIKEVPVEKIKEVVKVVTVEKIKEIPVEVIKYVPIEKIIEIPVEVIKEVPVEVIKEVPVEKIKEIVKLVTVEKIVEVIKEVPVEKTIEIVKEIPIEVIKEVPVEVIKEVPVEKIKEVIKVITVEKIKEVPTEIIKEVPVEVIKEVPIEVIKEVPVTKFVEIIKEVPVEKIVEVMKERVELAYDTEIIIDETIAPGVVEVRQEGVKGEMINGVTTKDPVKKIIAVGSKTTLPVSFNTDYVEDPELPVGKTAVKTEGVNGEMVNGVITTQPVKQVVAIGTKTVVPVGFETDYVQDPELPVGKTAVKTEGANGEMINGVITTAPVKQIVAIGTKQVTVLPFNTDVVFDPELAPGTEVVRTEGIDGEMTNGEITTQPVNKVIAVGSQVTKVLPFGTDYVQDPELAVGETAVRTEGVNGEMVNGVITTAPVKQVVAIGTKQVTIVPFETDYVQDPELTVGETAVRTEGVNGEMINGTITTAPTKQVVAIGTKRICVINFNTDYVFDPNLAPGTQEVRTEGVNGEMTNGEVTTAPVNKVVAVGSKVVEIVPFTYEIFYDNNLDYGSDPVLEEGVHGEKVNGVVTKPMTPGRVHIGDRLPIAEPTAPTLEVIPFETDVVFDETLPAGTHTVRTEGVTGERIVASGEVTRTPTTRVIVVGTKAVEVVPFGTEVIFDPDLAPGVEEVRTEGVNGEKVNGTVITQPVNKVVAVGKKVVEIVPFDVEIVYDNTLPLGTEVVRTQGVNGEKVNGHITTAPVNKVVAVGDQRTEVIPSVIEEYEDPDVLIGETRITPGSDGLRVNGEVTREMVPTRVGHGSMAYEPISIHFPDGRQVLYWDSPDDMRAGNFLGSQPLDRMFEKLNTDGDDHIPDEIVAKDGTVYTNPTHITQIDAGNFRVEYATKDKHEVVPFETEIVYDENELVGTETVRTEGVNGEKINGVVTTQPVNKVIVIGTQCRADIGGDGDVGPAPMEILPNDVDPPMTVLKTPITIELPNGETVTVETDNPDDLTALANHPGIPPEVVKITEAPDGLSRTIATYHGTKTIVKTADGRYVVNYSEVDHEVEIDDDNS